MNPRQPIAVGLLLPMLACTARTQELFQPPPAAAAPQEGAVEPDARMLRMPDVSADSIVFVYAENLWVVPRAGGLARKITSHRGVEAGPRFSPDGRTIAFTGEYEGNQDVYTIPVEGGPPQRVTWHPGGDVLVDWFPDGKELLFRSRRASPTQRYGRLFRVAAEGGLAAPLPLAIAELGALSPDGRSIVFQTITVESRTWKRYRGGMAPELWEFDLESYASRRVAPSDASDHFPMWHGDRIYFLSDRGGKANLWCFERGSGAVRPVTRFDEYDVLWPSLGPDAIVFENGGRLYLLDLATEQAAQVHIAVRDDMPMALPQMKSVAQWRGAADVSPSGKRAVFEARGDVFTVPAKEGRVRNLTESCGVAERYPAWSPDGKWIAYFSDRSGEYELTIRPAEGGEEKQLTKMGPGWRYDPAWSPDGKRIAFRDHVGRLWVVATEGGVPVEVDRDGYDEIRDYQWSPDSRWLAYSRSLPNYQSALFLWEAEPGLRHQVTSGMSSDRSPSFDPEGKYLWFASFRDWSPTMAIPEGSFTYEGGWRLYALPLRKDVKSPVAPRSDEEGAEEEVEKKEDEEKKKEQAEEKQEGEEPGEPQGGEGKKKQEEKQPEPVVIDLDGLEERAVVLPPEAGEYRSVRGVKGGVLYLRQGEKSTALLRWSLKEHKEETVLADVDGYVLAAKGEKLLYFKSKQAGIVDAKPGQEAGKDPLRLDEMTARIDPREEWAQLYRDAWRIERDFFYDEQMHGVDWKAAGERYERLLPFVASRRDLNFVIGELIGELCSSHAYVGGGDVPEVPRVGIGLLGCDYELDAAAGRYRIARIYEGEPGGARSPLLEPGVDVRQGDFLLAVDGRQVRAPLPPYAFFEGMTGKPVRIAVSASADGQDERTALVEALESESALRHEHWVRETREHVAERTGGLVGYAYVPNTGQEGLNALVRQFLAQRDRQGFIVDERWNGGGMIPDRFVELLNRKPLNFWARRGFEPWQTPGVYHDGPKVMLINEWAGSGGDAFPYYFRETGAGVLVGKRTWGGLIGISGNPQLIDGGSVTAPTFSFWDTGGEWAVENRGVQPDVEVENTPTDLARGVDAQLEKAIELVLDGLKKHPPLQRVRPAPVVR